MSTQTPKKQMVDETRIGEYAAAQPLSGTVFVGESYTVNGVGHGRYVREEEATKNTAQH